MHLIHRCQRGFTTITLMGTLLVGGLLVAGSFAAVDPDIGFTAKDEDSKQAYGAAEAGLAYYMNRLGLDTSYYVKCTNVTPPAGPGTSPVYQVWNGTTPATDPRVPRAIPGYNAGYAIELLPAPGYTACQEGVQESMIDTTTGAFRIRSTGFAGKRKRSIVATLRRKSFIDYLYFTEYETSDPATYDTNQQDWASDNCVEYRALRNSACREIRFITQDDIRGPLHTNDSALICGTPTFGSTTSDAIELNGVSPGWEADNGCGGSSPDFDGTLVHPGGILPMPPSNTELKNAALAGGSTYNGETTIVFTSSGGMTVNGVSRALPANGVIYVSSTAVCPGYSLEQNYGAQAGCGNVRVSGTYNSDITIGADNDIIVMNDFRRGATGALAGLVANNFVRVYHPVDDRDDGDCDNDGGPGGITIEAAILALNHSFIVDNWYCGNDLGTLTVYGAIAQRFRGPVGTGSGGNVSTGYAKDYNYNPRLKYREPPFFIDPVQSPWRINRQNEQVPAR